MIKDYFRFAFRTLTHRKLRSWLTMIGIFIGIASVVALIGLGEGLRVGINSQMGFLGTDKLTVMASGGMIGAPGSGVVNPLTNKELNAIKSVKGIELTAGRVMESTKIIFNDKISFSYATSVPDGEGRELVESVISSEAQKGRLLRDGDSGVVVLGSNFIEEDNVFGKAILPGSKIQINDEEFKVIGILDKIGNFQVDGSVLLNEDDMRALFDIPKEEYDIIAAQFDQDVGLDKIKLDIEKRLRKIRDVKEGEEDFSVETPASIIESVNSVILGVQIFVYIIAGISLLVGGIGIMNTMYTAVAERTKQIGIMKAIGARNSTIFTLFFIESGFLGTVGGIIGIVIGYLLATGVAFIGSIALGSDLISAHFSAELIIGALLFSFILGSFFGTLPAIQASRLNPVDAMRFSK